MVGVAGVGDPRLWPDWTGGPDRARRGAANGDAVVNPRRRRLGFILAAVAVLLALVLPLSSEIVPTLLTRPNLLAFVLAAALLFATAAWIGGAWATALGFCGVLCAAATTLALLHDADINGSAAIGFWVLVLAAWLGAILCV